MPGIGWNDKVTNALRSTVVLAALSMATPALASYSVATTYSFDASGNETLVSYLATSPSGMNCLAGGELCGGPTLATVTNYSAVNFNSTTRRSNSTSNDVTEIIGTLNGGNTIYDLSFHAAYNSPLVQTGIKTVIGEIMAAGGPGVTISNPQLVSSTVSTSSTSSSTYTVSAVDTSSVVTTAIGVAPINALAALTSSSNYDPVSDTLFRTTVLHPELAPPMPNVYTVCTPALSTITNGAVMPVAIGTVLATAPSCTPNNGGIYTLAPGQTDINVAFTTTYTIDTTTTTTNTTTTTAIYDINGVTSGNAPSNPPPGNPAPGVTVPEPNSLALLVVTLCAVPWHRRRIARDRASG